MRSICKKGSATLVAVLALCAFAAASASAAELYVGGKALSGTAAFAETPKVEGSITISYPTFKIACTAIKLEEGSEPSGLVSPGGAKFTRYFNYENCKFTEAPSGCSFSSPADIWGAGLEGTIAKGTGTEDIMTIKYPGGYDFGSFEVSGTNCVMLGNNVLWFNKSKPSLALAMPTGQTESVEQALVFPGEKEKIEYAGAKSPVYVKGTFKLKLASGAKWSFH
jgi:hypothetical protein